MDEVVVEPEPDPASIAADLIVPGSLDVPAAVLAGADAPGRLPVAV